MQTLNHDIDLILACVAGSLVRGEGRQALGVGGGGAKEAPPPPHSPREPVFPPPVPQSNFNNIINYSNTQTGAFIFDKTAIISIIVSVIFIKVPGFIT